MQIIMWIIINGHFVGVDIFFVMENYKLQKPFLNMYCGIVPVTG